MKTFLLLSVFAMASAGIYGFADMSNDIAKGKMIDYRKIEAERTKQNELANKPWIAAQKTIKPGAQHKSEHAMQKAVSAKPKKVKQPQHQFHFHHFSRGDFEEERVPPPPVEESQSISLDSTAIAPQ